MDVVNVAGWLVRINGKKYPRGHTGGDGEPYWTYRYTPEEGNIIYDGRVNTEMTVEDKRNFRKERLYF